MKTLKKRKSTGKTTKTKSATRSYDDFLAEQLADLDFAAGYLTACLEEGEDVFFLGLKNLAMAQGGMKTLSDATKLNRENLYDMLSKKGNPRFSNIATVLDKLGLELRVVPKMHGNKAA